MNNSGQLQDEIDELRSRLAEAEDTLRAIRSGEVDALVVGSDERLLAFEGAESTYRILIEDMSEGALTLTAEGVILYANRCLAEMLKAPLENVIGSTVSSWVAARNQETLKLLLNEDGHAKRREEVDLVASDGGLVPVYLSASRIQLDGSLEAFGLVVTDLREQKRSEAILAEERLARSILDQAGEAIIVCDSAGQVLRSSQQAHALCGGNPFGQALDRVLPLHSLDGDALPLAALLPAANNPSRREANLERNGQVVNLTISVRRLLDEHNEALGSVIVLADISQQKRAENNIRAAQIELQKLLDNAVQSRRALLSVIEDRKLAEAALRESEVRFRSVVEQSLVGIVIVDNETVHYANPRACEILGYMQAEIEGRSLKPLVVQADWPPMESEIRRVVSGELPVGKVEFRARRKDGEEVIIGAQGIRTTHQGQAVVLGVMQDISEKKRSEKEIQRYVTQIETAFMSTVEVATTLSEMRDPYTAGHERRVADIAAAIGTELGFDERRLEGLRVAGHLHDLGKITVPAEILAKPGQIAPVELQLIRQHAQASFDILKNVEFPWPIAEIAFQHHERMDGSGYPRGLKGDAILLEARILAVADTIEAMSSHRPYRPALGIDKALAAIERGRATAYDPDVADACLRLFREKGYAISA